MNMNKFVNLHWSHPLHYMENTTVKHKIHLKPHYRIATRDSLNSQVTKTHQPVNLLGAAAADVLTQHPGGLSLFIPILLSPFLPRIGIYLQEFI